MKFRLTFVDMLAFICLSLFAKAEERFTYQFGKDEMVFASALRTNDYGSGIGKNVKRMSVPKIETGKLPLREGISIYRSMHLGLIAETKNQFMRVYWQNIGEYLNEIRDAEQMICLLNVLHYDFGQTRIDLIGLSNILQRVTSHTNDLPFLETHGQVEEDTIQRGVFEQEGFWFAHFLCVEGASVVEYKYVLSKNNGLARLRRVVLKGPENPSGEGDVPRLIWNTEKEARYKLFQRCFEYLMSQTMNPHVDRKAGSKNKTKSKEASAGEPVNVPHKE